MALNVPTLDGNQVQSVGIPSVRARGNVTAQDFGGGLANELGSALTQSVVKARKEADDIATMEADRKLAEAETKILYDPNNGAMNKRGKEAFETPGVVEEEYTKAVSDIENTLTTPAQKMAFKQKYGMRQIEINRQISKHVANEIQVYDGEQTAAFMVTERNAAIANPYDLDRIQSSIARQQEEIIKHGERSGKSKEWIDQKSIDAASSTHSGVIEKMLASGKDLDAKNYWEANKDNIVGDQSLNIQKQIETGSLRGESQRAADSIFDNNKNSMTKAFEEVKKIQDPQLRDATMDRVRNNFELKKSVDRERTEKLHINATNIIDSTGDINKIPPAEWNQFTLSERSALKQYAAAKASNKDIVTDLRTYQDLKAIMTANPNQFMQTDLVGEYINKLGSADMKEMIDIQSKMRSGSGGADEILAGFRTSEQTVNDLLLEAGIKKDSERAVQFRHRLDQEVKKEAQDSGKKVPTNRVKELAFGLMAEGTKSWFGGKKTFELNDDDINQIEYDDIPEEDKKLIQQTIRNNKLVDDDETYLMLYKTKLKGS